MHIPAEGTLQTLLAWDILAPGKATCPRRYMRPAGQVTGGSAPFPFRLCSQEAEAPLLPPLAQGPAKPTSLHAPGVTPHLQELNRMCLRVFQKEVTDYQPSKSSCNKV